MFALIVLSGLWSLAPALADEIQVSEARVLVLFFERNLDLIAAYYQIDRAEAEELIAAAIPNPILTIGANELAGDFSIPKVVNGLGMGMNVAITQLLETNGKRDLRIESSRLGREAFEIDFKDSVRILANTVRHAYYGLLFAQKSLDIARDNLQRYQEIVKANTLRLKAGDIAESDLMRVEVESYKANADVDSATSALKKARAELGKLLSWPEQSMDFVAEDQWPEGASGYLKKQEPTLIAKAYDVRPDLKAQQIRTSQAEKELELARRLIVPDVTVSAGYVRDAGNVYLDAGIVTISAPLPAFYQFQGEAGKAVVNLNDARLQMEQTRNQIRKEVIGAYAALQSANAIVARFEKEVLQRLDKVRTAAEFAYSQGATSLLALIDAERSYKAMMLDYYAALYDRTLAYTDLLKALGEERPK